MLTCYSSWIIYYLHYYQTCATYVEDGVKHLLKEKNQISKLLEEFQQTDGLFEMLET